MSESDFLFCPRTVHVFFCSSVLCVHVGLCVIRHYRFLVLSHSSLNKFSNTSIKSPDVTYCIFAFQGGPAFS